jgi:hypothetical protein
MKTALGWSESSHASLVELRCRAELVASMEAFSFPLALLLSLLSLSPLLPLLQSLQPPMILFLKRPQLPPAPNPLQIRPLLLQLQRLARPQPVSSSTAAPLFYSISCLKLSFPPNPKDGPLPLPLHLSRRRRNPSPMPTESLLGRRRRRFLRWASCPRLQCCQPQRWWPRLRH